MISLARPMQGDLLEVDLSSCKRCGGEHVALVFKPFELPMPLATHWALCPRTFEPILLTPKDRSRPE